jgi:hypothetical protein
MTLDKTMQEYRRWLADSVPSFIVPRRFVADERWTKATIGGGRYLGFLREYEPELPAILSHKHVIILGEPGAGKSTAGQSIIQHGLNSGDATALSVFTSLKSYDGHLQALLLQNVPAAILGAAEIARTYILDGIDEVSAGHRDTLLRELNDLIKTDPSAKIVLTARQAFAAHHATAFPTGFIAYHLLDFDNGDIRACAKHEGVDADAFLTAVRSVDCDEEICNPFVLTIMLQRYRERGSLSPLRSDNVGYVVDRLIQSRPLFNATRQRRALRMLAIACETAARNELSEEEALRVLLEAIELPPETARHLLGELSHSILIRTPGRISFQMRSYGEYLAAEELHDKSVDRLKELAFLNNTPVDTWLNAVTYLAEMNDKVRQYFATNYPEWLIDVSPAAFNEAERTALTRRLLHKTNQAQNYIVTQRAVSWRRLARLLTTDVIAELRTQLTSTEAHEKANALALLGILRQRDIVPQALQLTTEHRNASTLRYAAIIALINAADNAILDDLLTFTQPGDTYHLHLVDAIGSLCTPADFPRVLPLLERTNAGLSATYYHFGELRTKEALTAAIDYLTANPETLNDHRLDAYLKPLIDLLLEFWDADIANRIGQLLANLERIHFHNGRLAERIVRHVVVLDHDATAVRAMITALMHDGTRVRIINHLIRPLISQQAALWIAENAEEYGNDLAPWLPHGPTRDILAPQTLQAIQAQEQATARYLEEQQREQGQIRTTQEQHQNTIRAAQDINAIISAAARLPKEHWPALSSERQEWLTHAVNDILERLDLPNSIRWLSATQWTHPGELDPLLNLTDYYNLQLTNDVPIILALRSWSDNAISNYYRKNGLSPAAQEELANLLRAEEHESITRNILVFLRDTGYDAVPIRAFFTGIALDRARPAQLRMDAIDRLGPTDAAIDTLLRLTADQEPRVQHHVFRELVKRQHRATISRALATLTDDELRAAEVPVLESSPLDWIGDIKTSLAIDDLETLRQRTLALNLWRASSLMAGTIANMDKPRAAAIIRRQLPQTPADWREHFRQEADSLERTARVTAAQETPFDEVIKKLKGATSMIRVKVWCEGPSDRPVFRTLFRELGEHEIADTLDFVGGWPNLISEQEPERWLDGCREAVIIMDGDQGRKLTKKSQPLTDQAKDIERRFAEHPLTLKVLRRYGIENYLPRRAFQAVLGRDLGNYFPMPPAKKIEDHLCDPKRLWPRWLKRLRKKQPTTFYQKRLNEQAAQHLVMADIESSDLAEVIRAIKQRAEDARRY